MYYITRMGTGRYLKDMLEYVGQLAENTQNHKKVKKTKNKKT